MFRLNARRRLAVSSLLLTTVMVSASSHGVWQWLRGAALTDFKVSQEMLGHARVLLRAEGSSFAAPC